MTDFLNDSPYLEHHGILGMKWGVRRYQNPDGSLTPAGRRRVQKAMKSRDVMMTTKDKKEHNQAEKEFRKITSKLYPAEMQNLIERVERDEALRKLSQIEQEDKYMKGFQYANEAVKLIGNTATAASGIINVTKGVQDLKAGKTRLAIEKARFGMEQEKEAINRIRDDAKEKRAQELHEQMSKKNAKDLEYRDAEIAKTLAEAREKDARSETRLGKISKVEEPKTEVPKTEVPKVETIRKATSAPSPSSLLYSSQTRKAIDNSFNAIKNESYRSFTTSNASTGKENYNRVAGLLPSGASTSVYALPAYSSAVTSQPSYHTPSLSELEKRSLGHSNFKMDENFYLAHHGILGMKWGVRRYQNKDGSLTAAGMRRYSAPEGYMTAKKYQNRLNDVSTATDMLSNKISNKENIRGKLVSSKAKTDAYINFDGGTALERAKSKLLDKAIGKVDESINRNVETREKGYKEMASLIESLQNSGYKITAKPSVKNVNAGKDYVAALSGTAAAGALGYLTLLTAIPPLTIPATAIVGGTVLGASVYSLVNNTVVGNKYKVEKQGG